MKNIIYAMILALSSMGYAQENVPVKVLENGDFGSEVRKLFVDPNSQQRCVVSLTNGLIQYYDGHNWQELHYLSEDTPIKAMSVNWSHDRPRIMIGLKNGGVQYYNGLRFASLQGSSKTSGVTQMSVDWESAIPRVVIGLDCGAVMYYDGVIFSLLQKCDWRSPVVDLSVDWSKPHPRIIAALECGAVKYYDGHDFSWLHSCTWDSKPARMSVNWEGGNPKLVIALKSSAIHYFDGQNFSTLAIGVSGEKPRQMAVDWSGRTPQIVLGYDKGLLNYYDGARWLELHDSSWGLPIRQMSVNFSNSRLPRIVVGLGTKCKGCPKEEAEAGGIVSYFDGSYWRELHGKGWKSPIIFMDVNWLVQRDPVIAIGQGFFYWDEGNKAHEALSRVAVYASGKWAIQAFYRNPVCAMNVKWVRDSLDPIILYCLGKNVADVENGKPQGSDAYKIMITQN